MGRHLLLIALAAALVPIAACSDRGAQADDAHASLPCARCHDGGAIERTVAAATESACTSCHDEGGGGRVALGDVTIEHRDHPGDTALGAGCAACHTHERGGQALRITTTGCTLCHSASLDGSRPSECRLCHTRPGHMGVTSQGVPVAHSSLPWIGGECIRCHYDVGQAPTTVAADRCVECHASYEDVAAAGAGHDLHPDHTGVGCSSCHEAAPHQIVAMSSGVQLVCAQCHTGAHEVGPDDVAARDVAVCNDCHVAIHGEKQRMMLGVAPAHLAGTPSDKFLVGLTCRSCHVTSPSESATRIDCVGCHGSQYATVLEWWRRGSAERLAEATSYVAAARAASSGSDSARARLAAADSLLAFVRAGDAAHNLPLSHEAMLAALERAAAAWGEGSTAAPAPPDLGRAPRMGQCTYCHYVWREPRFREEMPDRFHREVMARGQEAARRLEAGTR